MAGGGSVGDEAGDDVGVFERDRAGVELFDEAGEAEFGSAGRAASWEVDAKAQGFFEVRTVANSSISNFVAP